MSSKHGENERTYSVRWIPSASIEISWAQAWLANGGGSGQGQVGLSHFSRSTPPLIMPTTRASRKEKEKNPTTYRINKNLINVFREDYGICWCEGENVGCRAVVSASTRRRHKAREKKKRLQGRFWESLEVSVGADHHRCSCRGCSSNGDHPRRI